MSEQLGQVLLARGPARYGRLRRALTVMCLVLGACAPVEDALDASGNGSVVTDAGNGDAGAGVVPPAVGGNAGGATGGAVANSDGGGTGTRGPAGDGGTSNDGGAPVRGDAGGDASTGGSAPPAAASAEDEGADCQVGALPEANALPMIAKLPDPFTKLDGKGMTTKAEWRCRRQEIKKLAEKFGYGTKPPKPESVSGTVSNTSITVKVTDNGKSAMFTASVKLPGAGMGPYPAVIVYGGGGFGAPLDNAVLTSEGIATISYDPFSVGREGTPRNNKQGAFYSIAGSNSSTGLLVAWAWGVSRIIDVIEQSGGAILKADAIAVTGCSRFGKGSFFAGVFDQRVALTMPIESGSAGVPIWRGIPGEGAQSLSSAYGEQPWLGDGFSSFTGKPTSLPFDTHEMVAMVAPRGLFIMDNPHIANLGPRSASVAALAGAEVYKALGAGDNITYHSDVQNGAHCAVRPEWSMPLRNCIQKFLKRTGSAPGMIKMSSKATGNLADWREWQTPALQ
jgi:hypothetical protein